MVGMKLPTWARAVIVVVACGLIIIWAERIYSAHRSKIEVEKKLHAWSVATGERSVADFHLLQVERMDADERITGAWIPFVGGAIWRMANGAERDDEKKTAAKMREMEIGLIRLHLTAEEMKRRADGK